MYRLLYFLLIIFLPIVFGWWLFIGLAVLLVYLAKLPYEIIVAGAILDAVYYFGEGFVVGHRLTLFALILILVAWFLNKRISWRKII